MKRLEIGMLHHDLEFAEQELTSLLRERDVIVNHYDVRNCFLEKIIKNDLVLNRVYASVANRDYRSIVLTLNLLREIEKRGVYCLNSYKTSGYDYDKYQTFRRLSYGGVPTPESIFIDMKEDLKEKSEKLESLLGFPLIIKRNSGGRGKDVCKIETPEEFVSIMSSKRELARGEGYFGSFIAQEFVKPVRGYDCRVNIIDGNYTFAFARTLIPSKEGEEPWFGSVSNGSKELPSFRPTIDEINLAIRSTNLIGALVNEVDISFSEDGPVVIENNPTPNYFNKINDNKRMVQFVDSTLNFLKRNSEKSYKEGKQNLGLTKTRTEIIE
ncbi:ATP-grasp domain-containing protein [Patescibacteria group bacterium]|nr:ATP-grasp domain-containing protein [Patescibacteria group bacterium]